MRRHSRRPGERLSRSLSERSARYMYCLLLYRRQSGLLLSSPSWLSQGARLIFPPPPPPAQQNKKKERKKETKQKIKKEEKRKITDIAVGGIEPVRRSRPRPDGGHHDPRQRLVEDWPAACTSPRPSWLVCGGLSRWLTISVTRTSLPSFFEDAEVI
ncbi:hypothetical protein VTK56DRAFT_4119 [Thermocarpiscus australiensis]